MHNILPFILLLSSASATTVHPYRKVVTHRGAEGKTGAGARVPAAPDAGRLHSDPGLLNYGMAVRASKLTGPLSWALKWALRTAKPRGTATTDYGAAESLSATWGSGGTGGGSGSCDSFQELYGGDEGGFGGLQGACYDAITDGVAGAFPGAPGHDAVAGGPRRDPGGNGGGGADVSTVANSSTRTLQGVSVAELGGGPTAETEAAAGVTSGAVAAGPSARPPVIYIPPLTGTELLARLNDKPSTPRWWCPRRTSSWFRLWVSLESLLPWEFPCFADNLRLVPGGPDGRATPPPGVEVRLGATLEPAQGDPRVGDGGGFQPWSSVAHGLRQRGWSEDLLDTHPYDWRLSPVDWSVEGGSFQQLRTAIQSKVAASGRRVVLVGLSLGATYAVSFLTSPLVDEGWKERHVERLVTMSGVWLGTPRSSLDVISGRLQGLENLLGRDPARQLVQGIPALTWTFPAPPHPGPATDPPPPPPLPGAAAATAATTASSSSCKVGDSADPIIVTNVARGRNYTASQLGQALRDAGAEQAAAFWEASRQTAVAAPPNVSTHCFYSYGLRCAVHVTYDAADFSDPQPDVRYDDGDVTVPHASLAACRSWAARQVAPVRTHSYYGVVHGLLTSVPEALRDIIDAIAGEAG